MSLALILHVLAAVVWVGGMFFAFVCLRPATQWMDPPQRLRLWTNVLSRFFRWVWLAAAILLVSGLWMTFVHFGGLRRVEPHIHVMFGLGLAMMALAAHAYFAPYKRLKRAVQVSKWPEAARQLNQIRTLIAVNLALAIAVLVAASGGRYW